MTIPTLPGYDATGLNERVIPLTAQAAGYDTGSGNVPWTAAQFARHTTPYPAIHIDQDPNAIDATADFLDVEAFAATVGEVVGWIGRARDAFDSGKRRGQRWPGIYCSMSLINTVVGALHAARVVSVPFWIANYGYSSAAAQAYVAAPSNATADYPTVGFQHDDTAFGGLADDSWWSVPYLTTTNNVPTTKDVDMIYGTLTPDAYVGFPAGAFKTLTLYRDFVTAPITIRVAIHSPSGYTVNDATLSSSVPVFIPIGPTDDAVSLAVTTTDPGGIAFTLA